MPIIDGERYKWLCECSNGLGDSVDPPGRCGCFVGAEPDGYWRVVVRNGVAYTIFDKHSWMPF